MALREIALHSPNFTQRDLQTPVVCEISHLSAYLPLASIVARSMRLCGEWLAFSTMMLVFWMGFAAGLLSATAPRIFWQPRGFRLCLPAFWALPGVSLRGALRAAGVPDSGPA